MIIASKVGLFSEFIGNCLKIRFSNGIDFFYIYLIYIVVVVAGARKCI